MGKLSKLAEGSKLMEIDITYNGKRYRFNLYEELQINERTLNKEVKNHPSSYSFLTQLLNHLIYETETLEKNVERTFARLYVQYKENKTGSNGRAASDDLCKQSVLASKTYKKAVHEYLQIKFHKNTLEKAVKSFETKGFLIQTLSANLRKEQ